MLILFSAPVTAEKLLEVGFRHAHSATKAVHGKFAGSDPTAHGAKAHAAAVGDDRGS